MKYYIKREKYIEKITPFIDKDIIKVLIGQRRVGKSYMLFQIMDLIREIHKNPHIIYINKELHEYDHIMAGSDLLDFIKEKREPSGKCYLFLDEVQEITNFEKALRNLAASGGYDIYCTGSNATMLSSEIATVLAGRSIQIRIYGLCYREFLHFHGLSDSDDVFALFMKYGGLPYLINLDLKDEIVFEYLKNIYNTILFRDVVSRYSLRNTEFLERLTVYIADNTGSLVSAKRISDFLKSQRTNISPQVVLSYLSYLTNAFFLARVARYDISGKKIFEIGKKYYFEDVGLRHSLSGFLQKDINKILENLVYLHLRHCGYTVFVGKHGEKEIDFIGEKHNERIYVQVSYLIPDDEVRAREFGNLLEIEDNFPKIVVSMDPVRTGEKGIKHLHIREFLLSEEL
jgi:predicted AAA+ superfamily ATPase